MAAANGKPRRVDVGFAGGQVLGLRLEEGAYKELRAALEGDDAARWHEVVAEDSEVAVDLSKIVYVRLDTEQRGVGFSGP
ncbi:MAG TPA: hypothetical protein VF520_17360 [Thermoleophilaceae bacterium]|jgi:hypothetical protein